MPFIATPQQLEFLRQAVDEYCRDCGLTDGDDRLLVAEMASALFDVGVMTLVDLRRGLERAMGSCRPEPEAEPAA